MDKFEEYNLKIENASKLLKKTKIEVEKRIQNL